MPSPLDLNEYIKQADGFGMRGMALTLLTEMNIKLRSQKISPGQEGGKRVSFLSVPPMFLGSIAVPERFYSKRQKFP